MTRFRPACESLDARTLPSAVVGGGETSLLGLLRTADDAAAGHVREFKDALLTSSPFPAGDGSVKPDDSAGAHALYQDVFIPAGVSPDDAGFLHHGNIDRLYHFSGAAAGSGDDGYDHTLGGGSWGVAVSDPEAGMLLPAVQKVRDAAARM